jgi:hypothetical protein
MKAIKRNNNRLFAQTEDKKEIRGRAESTTTVPPSEDKPIENVVNKMTSDSKSVQDWGIKFSSSLTLANDLLSLVEGSLDTAEDALLHFRRYIRKQDLLFIQPHNYDRPQGCRPRIVVLGSGWSAHAFLKIIDTDIFDVVCVSPRPYFVFTPMLASTAVGTVEYRSIIEPIRAANPFVEYIDGEVYDIDIQKNTVSVKSDFKSPSSSSPLSTEPLFSSSSPSNQKGISQQYDLQYDYLVNCVGARVADFGIKGVQEHCYFIKEIDDVRHIKMRILTLLELASLPQKSEKEMKELLSFVVVGGGPTGVEFVGKQ